MTAAEDSATLATSWPQAMNIAVIPLAACRPLFTAPDKGADVCHGSVLDQPFRRYPHHRSEHLPGDDHLGSHPLASLS